MLKPAMRLAASVELGLTLMKAAGGCPHILPLTGSAMGQFGLVFGTMLVAVEFAEFVAILGERITAKLRGASSSRPDRG